MRINITGNAGSGKSTLSHFIVDRLEVPLIEMDKIIWQPGWTKTKQEVTQARLEKLLAMSSWVLDGVSRQARQSADFIVFLDFPRRVCFWRCLKRNWRYLFSSRPGLPKNCPELLIIPELIKIIYNFPLEARSSILRDIENKRCDQTVVIIRNQKELNEFKRALSKNLKNESRGLNV